MPWRSSDITLSLRWRHNGYDSDSNHQPHNCLLNRLFRHRSRKHQSSVSLAFVWGIHRGPVNSPHKWPVTRKMFPFDDVIMNAKLHRNLSTRMQGMYHMSISLLNPFSFDDHSLTRLLVGWQLCWQPIRNHVGKLHSAENDANPWKWNHEKGRT